MAEIQATFTDEIPRIEREGFRRGSKYTPLLDECVKRPGKAARITVDAQGKASSRASSIREAADKHPATVEGQGYFRVATRSGEEDGQEVFHVYVQYNEGEQPEEHKPRPRKVAKKRTA